MRVAFTLFFLIVIQILKAQVTLQTEVKISDIGLHFNGSKETIANANTDPNQPYDYFFGNKISAHGDCITSYGDYIFMTWYKGGKSERNVMLSRYNTITNTISTIEFPHKHTGYLNQWWIGESHNTIAISVSPKNGTIHLLYDMHAYGTNRPSDGSLSNDYFRYSYSVSNAATLSDAQFTLDKFITNANGRYKHLSLNGGEDYSNFSGLTYPQFFKNDAGDLFLYLREGGNNNGAYKFSKYDATTSSWSSFTNFNILNAKNQPQINYNWGLYGNMKYLNGKIRIGFQRRANITDKYLYQNGVYYAYSDNQDGTSNWKNDAGTAITLPLVDPDQVKIMEPGDFVSTTQIDQVSIVSDFDWTVTDNGDVHFISKVRDTENNVTKKLHTYRPSGSSTFITSDNFAGGEAIYTAGGDVYVIGLSSGKVFVDKTAGGTNNFSRVYNQTSGRSFRHGQVHVNNGKAYYYLLENNSSGGSSQPLYLQIIDLDIPTMSSAQTTTATKDGDWNDATVWDNGVPQTGYNVVIPTQMEVTMQSGTVASINSLNIGGTNARLRQKTNTALTVVGDLTIERSQDGYFFDAGDDETGTLIVQGALTNDRRMRVTKALPDDNQWHLFSFGFRASRLREIFNGGGTTPNNNFATNSSNTYAFSYYDGSKAAGSKYIYPYNTTNTGGFGTSDGDSSNHTEHGRGYSLKTAIGQKNITWRAKFPVENVAINISDVGDKYNLLGNPYPAYLHANSNANATNNILDINTGVLEEETIWLWDAATGSFTPKNQISAAFRINPMQGFFIKAKSGGGSTQSFSFTEAMQSHNKTNNFFKTTNPLHIELKISGQDIVRATDVFYINEKTIEFDNGYDSSLFNGASSNFSIYTYLLGVGANSTKKLSIQSLPVDYKNLVIPVGVTVPEEKEYTFSVNVSNLPKGYNVFLEDRVENTFTRLDEIDAKYSVTLSGVIEGRFYIHTKTSVLNIEEQLLNTVNIFKNDEAGLNLVGLPKENVTLTLYSMLGKEVYLNSFVSKPVNKIKLPSLAKGVYIVRVSTKGGTVSKKIILD